MDRYSRLLVILLLGYLCNGGDSNMVCHEREKQALLCLKQGFTDPSNRLSSWTTAEQDCCKWEGVACSNRSGHVTELHLRNPYEVFVHYGALVFDTTTEQERFEKLQLGGEIKDCVLELKHLNYLDLSLNDFGATSIPEFFGLLPNLRYLNLSGAGFSGLIPHQLGNISNLRYLNLRTYDSDINNPSLYADKLEWLSGLSSLQYLDMGGVDLHSVANWLQEMNTLPSLSELVLRACNLDIPSSLRYVNFTSLTFLDLSYNSASATMVVPTWVFNLSSLVHLDLSFTCSQCLFPDAIENLKSLEFLDLSGNIFVKDRMILNSLWNLCNLKDLHLSSINLRGELKDFPGNFSGCVWESLETLDLLNNELTGPIPDWLLQIKNLKYLHLSYNALDGPIPAFLSNISSLIGFYVTHNQLYGTLPESIGQLSNLETLFIGDNHLEGVVSEAHFANLSKLKYLDMALNDLFLNVNSNWLPPFQLKFIMMGNNTIGPKFPTWLHTQKSIDYLSLSNTKISDTVPNWFWNMASHFKFLGLSRNQISGDLSNVTFNTRTVDLSSNRFKSQLPLVSPNVTVLVLTNNSFSGLVSSLLCQPMEEQNALKYLDLSQNLLSGEIPECWMYWSSLLYINLGNNNLTGKIPSSLGSLPLLKSLHLSNNSFFGDLPSSLQNCTHLNIIDVGENKFSGTIPEWIGESITNLSILSLRSNKFNGLIPPSICHLTSLQVLDLGHNFLTGSIPLCLNNFSAMAKIDSSNPVIAFNYSFSYFVEKLFVTAKGTQLQYTSILSLVKSMDLSSNNLSGEIPEKLSSLSGLRFLNLSGNHLVGKIPEKIGNMQSLESLDFSRNKLSGEIPHGMTSLSFLNDLNLSYNNLSGKIPLSTQLQSFKESNYAGNRLLCGPPLLKKCEGENESQAPSAGARSEEDESEMLWFYISMGPGFVVGFWGVCGVLLFKKNWRYVYFHFLEDIIDKVYVKTTIFIAWLQQQLKRNQVGP